MSDSPQTWSDEERLLADALAARAQQVTDADLRLPAPPGEDGGRRRTPVRWLPLLAAAAMIIAVFTLFLAVGPLRETPPAGPPGPSITPAPAPSTPVVPSTPDPVPTSAVPPMAEPSSAPSITMATSPPPPIGESPGAEPGIAPSP
jgi:hypothetical protein